MEQVNQDLMLYPGGTLVARPLDLGLMALIFGVLRAPARGFKITFTTPMS